MRKSKVSFPYSYCTDLYEVVQEVIRNNFIPDSSEDLHDAIELATKECVKMGYDEGESECAASEFAELYCCSQDIR